MSSYLFTSESVSEGHPDKVADQISDAILDAILEKDKKAHVACETMVKTGVAIIGGEITTSAWVDLEEIIRKVIVDIGYDSSEVGFDGHTCAVMNIIGKQSPDIKRGVSRERPEDQGAGGERLLLDAGSGIHVLNRAMAGEAGGRALRAEERMGAHDLDLGGQQTLHRREWGDLDRGDIHHRSRLLRAAPARRHPSAGPTDRRGRARIGVQRASAQSGWDDASSGGAAAPHLAAPPAAS